MKLNKNNLFEIKDYYIEKMQKHEVVKLILVMKLLEKYKKLSNSVKIYNDFEILDNRKCDLYFENLKEKYIVIYEIEEKINKGIVRDLNNDYKNIEIPFMKHTQYVIIPLENCPDDIKSINIWLDKYLV